MISHLSSKSVIQTTPELKLQVVPTSTWVSLQETGCQRTTAAASLLVGRPADPGRSPTVDIGEAHALDLILQKNKRVCVYTKHNET